MRKKLLIIISLFIFCLGLCNVCFASSLPVMDEELAQSIIDYCKSVYPDKSCNLTSTRLSNEFNSISFSDIESNLDFYNVSFYPRLNYNDSVEVLFVISNNSFNSVSELGFLEIDFDSSYSRLSFNDRKNIDIKMFYINPSNTYVYPSSGSASSFNVSSSFCPYVQDDQLFIPGFTNLKGRTQVKFSGLNLSNTDVRFVNNNLNFFPEAPQVEIQEGSLAGIVQQVENKGLVLQEIVTLLPIILVVIVGFLALRKFFQMLLTFLHQS